MPRKPAEPKIYYARNKRFRLGADKIRPEKRFNDGRIEQSSKVIEFHGHIFKTQDVHEQALIENCEEFRQGRVKVIDDKELQTVLSVQALQTQGTVAGATSPSEDEPVGVTGAPAEPTGVIDGEIVTEKHNITE